MTKISALTPLGDGLAVGDQFIIRDIDDAGTPNKSVTISGMTRGLDRGTNTAPAIAFAADKNTGIYSPGEDQLAVATNGTGRLFIDANGNVGVGVSPSAPLQVNGEVRFTRSGVASQYVGVITDGTDTRIFAEGSSKSLAIRNNSTGSSDIIFDQAVASSYIFNQVGTERLRITSAGLLGIGNSSPSTALDVSGAISLGSVAIPSAGTARIFSRNTDSNLYIQTGSGNTLNLLDGSQNTMASLGSSTVTLQTSNSPRLTITSTGLVGIGTTSPGAPLEVIGTAGTIAARATTGVSSQAIQIYNNGTDSYIDSTAYGAGSGGGIAFRRNGTGEMGRFDTSGRLLVGTTSADGLISNISPVVAGAFKSHSGSVSIAPSTTVTIFTIPASNGEGAYTVTAIYVNGNNVPVFSAYAVILYDGSATNAYRAMGFDGSLLSITVSGRDVQLTTGATYTQGIKWSFVKQAVA